MGLEKKEKELLRKFFFYPVALSIFSIILTGAIIFVLVLNYEKQGTKKDIEYVLKTQKAFIKNKVLDMSNNISLVIKQANKKTKNDVKKRVENFYYQILSLYKIYNKKSLIIKYLNNLNNYLNKDYIFAYDKNSGVVYVHKIKKYIGKNLKKIYIKPGFSIYQRNEKALKNGGFYETYFYKPNDLTKKYLKIDYIKFVPQLNLIIGSGDYVNDIKKKIVKGILERLNLKKFGKNNYFFVIRPNGVLLVNRLYKNEIGKNILNLKNKKGEYFVKRIISTALKNKNGGFVVYYSLNPITKKEEKKLSYVVYNKDLNAIIGAGLYFKNNIDVIINRNKKILNNEFKDINISIFVAIIVVVIISIIFSFYFSKRLKNIFNIYNKKTKQLLKKASFEATHDSLTKVPNRKYFNQKLKKEFYRAKRYKIPLSIAMVDIDYFKKINDTYGHDMGDKVLKKLASFCNSHIRESDLFSRWGGEEFMFIFPHTTKEEALKICEKIKEELQNNTKIQNPVKFTISCGVTELREDDTIDTFLKRVDDALYRAKENGRDRIEVI